MTAARPTLDPRAFLFSLEQVGIKLGLEQIRALLRELGHPDRAFRSIVVAGTNGKGSVVAMTERGLRRAGYRTGRYTSPHLIRLEERFAIDGQDIAADAFDRAAARVMAASLTLPFPPSFFEATTALAFEAFRDAAVDVAILEVGLGGRLDATNIVSPVATAITSVDFDHQQFLGTTLEAIAGEKAGIVKRGVPLILGDNPVLVDGVVDRVCREHGATLIRANVGVHSRFTMEHGRARLSLSTPTRDYGELYLQLRGRHQVQNAITAVRLLETLDASGPFRVPDVAIRTAVEDPAWPARLELLKIDSIEVLVDGAHNPAAAKALADFVVDTYGRLPMVIGIMQDKDIPAILRNLAPAAERFVFTTARSPRASAPQALVEAATHAAPSVPSNACDDPVAAVSLAHHGGTPVVVAGSLYLAGEIRARVT